MPKRVFTQCFPTVNAVIEKNDKFLLVQEGVKKGPDAKTWNLPGGWIDTKNDNPVKAIIREVREETGLTFKPQFIVGIFSLERKDLEKYHHATVHPIRILFNGKVSGKIKIEAKDEILDARWFSFSEIKKMNLRDKDIPEIIESYLKGERYPVSILHHQIQK